MEDIARVGHIYIPYCLSKLLASMAKMVIAIKRWTTINFILLNAHKLKSHDNLVNFQKVFGCCGLVMKETSLI